MSMSDLRQTLSDLHEELARARELGPGDRALLHSALLDIQRALEGPPESEEADAGHGDALEGAAVRLEAGHPSVASAIRAVLDALGKAGI
jgi:Domain of unknown function (DUF4404)